MSTQRFKNDLRELYQGEVMGEVVIEELLRFFDEPAQQVKLGAMHSVNSCPP